MYIMSNINGVETPITLPDWVFYPKVTVDGDMTTIDHGSYLEVMGTVSVECTTVTNGVIEGVATVQLPRGKGYFPQATAHNITDSPANVTGESAFVRMDGSTLKVYLTARSGSAKTMSGTYSVKVVK